MHASSPTSLCIGSDLSLPVSFVATRGPCRATGRGQPRPQARCRMGRLAPLWRATVSILSVGLHFSENTAASSPSDRAWKLRPVIDVLQKKFKDSYVIGDRISFDEMMLPNRSRMNPIRQYCPMKQRKYGAKLFAACCPVEAYCSKYAELYLRDSNSTCREMADRTLL